MWSDLTLLLNQSFSWCSNIIVLYFTNGILAFAFAIWIIRKVSKIIEHLLY